MKFKDEQGDLEITKELLVAMLQETYLMAVAYTIEYYGLSDRDRVTLRKTNAILKRTWQSHDWLENFIRYLYKRAREINNQPPTPPSEE